jgi:hypothetical protein
VAGNPNDPYELRHPGRRRQFSLRERFRNIGKPEDPYGAKPSSLKESLKSGAKTAGKATAGGLKKVGENVGEYMARTDWGGVVERLGTSEEPRYPSRHRRRHGRRGYKHEPDPLAGLTSMNVAPQYNPAMFQAFPFQKQLGFSQGRHAGRERRHKHKGRRRHNRRSTP